MGIRALGRPVAERGRKMKPVAMCRIIIFSSILTKWLDGLVREPSAERLFALLSQEGQGRLVIKDC